jgi:hypothetical protein
MATDSQAAPPFYPLTDENHAALVVITAIIFFIYAIFGIIGKMIIRLNITSMKDFDILLLAAALLYFVQTTCVIAACSNGLGEHRDAISEDDFMRFSKVGNLLARRGATLLTIIVDVCITNIRHTSSCDNKGLPRSSHQTNR